MMGVKINRSEKERPDRFAPNGIGGSIGGAPALGPPDQMSDSETDQREKLQLFEETILPHLNAAYKLARWLTGNEHDAQDVVQEAYLRAFRFFDSFKGGDGKSWLLAVVRNTCHTWRASGNAAE